MTKPRIRRIFVFIVPSDQRLQSIKIDINNRLIPKTDT